MFVSEKVRIQTLREKFTEDQDVGVVNGCNGNIFFVNRAHSDLKLSSLAAFCADFEIGGGFSR